MLPVGGYVISGLIGIDPGTRHLGWARSTNARITSAGCSSAPSDIRDLLDLALYHARHLGYGSADVAVIEQMHWDGRRMTTPQDLIDVATLGALVSSRVAGTVALKKPHEWKANLPKGIHHRRICQALDAGELALVTAAADRAGSRAKEVLDAVGITLHHLSRIDKSGVKL